VSGREVLWQASQPEPWPRDDFMAAPAGGWDNIFPNDAPWGDYPDHGLVWSRTFDVTRSSDTEVTLQLALAAPDVEIEFRYTLLGNGRRGLRQETTLKARADTGPFLWASHPMLSVHRGWRIELPPTEIRTHPEYSGRLPKGATLAKGGQHEALLVEPHESSFELRFAEGIGEATVGSPDDHSRTRVTWDASFLGHLWLVTISGFGSIDLELQVEPSSAHIFDLAEAVEGGTATSLSSGEERTFWVEIESLDRS
jgi:galactose mutarotase-like enzyme